MNYREPVVVEDLTEGDGVFATSIGFETSEHVIFFIGAVKDLGDVVLINARQDPGPWTVRAHQMAVPRGTKVERVPRHSMRHIC